MKVQESTDAVSIQQWDAWAEEGRAVGVVESSAPDPNATPCPVWCGEQRHTIERFRVDRRHHSDGVGVALQNHLASRWSNHTMNMATAEVTIFQGWNAVRPSVRLCRWASQVEDDIIGLTKGSEYTLTLDEAAELGRILLGAVDVALGLAEKAAK